MSSKTAYKTLWKSDISFRTPFFMLNNNLNSSFDFNLKRLKLAITVFFRYYRPVHLAEGPQARPRLFSPMFWRQKMENYMDYLYWKIQFGRLQLRVPLVRKTSKKHDIFYRSKVAKFWYFGFGAPNQTTQMNPNEMCVWLVTCSFKWDQPELKRLQPYGDIRDFRYNKKWAIFWRSKNGSLECRGHNFS